MVSYDCPNPFCAFGPAKPKVFGGARFAPLKRLYISVRNCILNGSVTRTVDLVTAHSAEGSRDRKAEGSRIYPLHIFETIRSDNLVRDACEWVANQIYALNILIGTSGVCGRRNIERLSRMEGEQAAQLP